MKFSVAWADVLRENLSLRTALVCLTAVTLLLGIVSMRLALKAPLVIERGCQTEALQLGESSRTEEEIRRFVMMSLPVRFNTVTADSKTYLSDQEFHNRLAEQQDLEKKNIRQTVLINTVEIKEGSISAEMDLIVSIGKIRSVFPFAVKAAVSTVPRSQTNPYGLLLSNASPVEAKEDE